MLARIKGWILEQYENHRWSQYYRLSAWATQRTPPVEGLRRWDDNRATADQDFVYPIRIVVTSEDHKQQVLLALRYLHDMREIDTEYHAVNTLVHIYGNPVDVLVIEP